MIHSLSVPCIVMASISIFVGLNNLFLYIKKTEIKENLSFALLCFSVSLYDIFCAGLYNSHTINTGIIWQRLQLNTGMLIAVTLIHFVNIFTEQKGNKIIRYFITFFIIILPLSFFIGPEYTLSVSRPAIKNINIQNFIQITYYEAEVGILYIIEISAALIAYIYLFYLLIRYFLKDKNKILIFFIMSQIAYFISITNDFLVSMQAYKFIYISEYSFFFIIIVMAYILLDKFANLQKAYVELNQKLEQKVEERTRELVRLNAELMNFIYLSSHDLQEPLRKISTLSDRLITKYHSSLEEQGRDYLKRINNAVIRMRVLIDDLLTYSRITIKATHSPVNLSEIVRDVLSDLEVFIENAMGRVETGSLPSIYADPTQMRHLFQNLIGNALKFHKPDFPPVVKVYSREDAPKGYCLLTVEDNGIGISEKYYDKIFGLFQRLHGKEEFRRERDRSCRM